MTISAYMTPGLVPRSQSASGQISWPPAELVRMTSIGSRCKTIADSMASHVVLVGSFKIDVSSSGGGEWWGAHLEVAPRRHRRYDNAHLVVIMWRNADLFL